MLPTRLTELKLNTSSARSRRVHFLSISVVASIFNSSHHLFFHCATLCTHTLKSQLETYFLSKLSTVCHQLRLKRRVCVCCRSFVQKFTAGGIIKAPNYGFAHHNVSTLGQVASLPLLQKTKSHRPYKSLHIFLWRLSLIYCTICATRVCFPLIKYK